MDTALKTEGIGSREASAALEKTRGTVKRTLTAQLEERKGVVRAAPRSFPYWKCQVQLMLPSPG